MRKKIITGIVIGVVLFSLAVAIALKGNGGKTAENTGVGEQIAVVHIEGTIMSSAPGGFGTAGVAAADRIVSELKEARENPEIKAVILKLNTGGGTVVGSDEIGREVERVRKSGKKVVAAMGEMAASGGYWISCKADKIVANPGTFTGSIGVIMQLTEMKDLYNKLGVEVNNIKTGAFKDMGASNKDLSPEERQIFQGLVNDSYEDFIQVVAAGRKMDPTQVRKLADGRIYTGKQAKQLGLVDELGDFNEAVRITANLAGIKGEPELVDMTGEQLLWQQLFGGLQGKNKILPIPLEGLLLLPDKVVMPINTNIQ
ncbi:signal peptide peptidase A, Serine peptidase, MEROPS family S49 [Desulforamulus reducens MI-1]|uniref:Signal peptide peptidase A, Serine peptidase, MEROPS family S49 n=1 Tax=Desulforamulus reducens (strain ATCC BAA-1160 / DSM 100696 / MI-1) TaxID=349161 RepID=A4J9C9_DESRM|nr:signal peptide peptidase SppA [Desulforamulus reducens]ABO51682.1 signal peptide peptidase A, Serine peptidase, MEROPS family S49 [Desulforamulus reducens MI-1]